MTLQDSPAFATLAVHPKTFSTPLRFTIDPTRTYLKSATVVPQTQKLLNRPNGTAKIVP
jgi:hypothetical protein